jgi:hypothetical protein
VLDMDNDEHGRAGDLVPSEVSTIDSQLICSYPVAAHVANSSRGRAAMPDENAPTQLVFTLEAQMQVDADELI